MSNSMGHTVSITSVPDSTTDDYGYAFGGSHSDQCMTLDPCRRKACQAMNPDRAPSDERFRHGKAHYYVDGAWAVESITCALSYVFEHTAQSEYFDGIEPGTYTIDISWEDDRWWFEIHKVRSNNE